MTRRISEALFTSILYLFSSAMLILSLLMSIKLDALSDQVKRTEDEISRWRKENAVLSAELESLTNMEAVAGYVEKAGMIPCPAENAETLILSFHD